MEQGHLSRQRASVTETADILLVEDDPNDAELTLSALESCGFADRVAHVSDGASALEYVASETLFASRAQLSLPRLILLDLNLRKLGGLHVLRNLKSDERTKNIPIIVLTSSKLAIEVVESYKLGVNSYVIKPIDAKKFAEVVAAIAHYWLVINEPPPATM
jgi:two-component system response regulator